LTGTRRNGCSATVGDENFRSGCTWRHNRPRGAKGKKDKIGVRTRAPVIPHGKGDGKRMSGKQERGISETRGEFENGRRETRSTGS